MNIEYTKVGDYYLPNLTINDNNKTLNKYGLLKLNYLKENKKSFYTKLLMKGSLNDYLFSVSNETQEKVNMLMSNYIKNNSRLTEKLKEDNQLLWVGIMNDYKSMSEEIVMKELIYN